MPFLSPDETAAIRKKLKAEMPEFKFSLRTLHYSSLNLTILQGPVDFGLGERGRESVNHYTIDRDYQDNKEALEALTKIMDVIETAKPRRIESEDGDYGSIPNYYMNMRIGDHDKPYQVKPAKLKA